MEIIKFEPFIDERGTLTPIELNFLSFVPKRIFVVDNVPENSIRGNHAHYKTKQFLICIKGQIEVILNDGSNESNFLLNENEGILVPELIWDAQKFIKQNSSLLVLCSTNYNEDDYILDFETFKKIIK